MSGKNTNTDILLAGAFAAFSVDLLVYPLDTLKTRLQSPDYNKLFINESTKTINKPALFRGLYQGVGSVIIATLPSSGAFFTSYEGVKSLLTTHNPTIARSPLFPSHATAPTHLLPQPLIHSLASSLAELVSCAILTPAEVIKQNAQMVDRTHSSSANATLQTLSKFRSNPLALWRGYTALAGRNLPFTALQFPMFEGLKTRLRRRREEQGKWNGGLLETGVVTALSAGSAGSVAAVVTTPIDVVKTRIMLGAGSESEAKPAGPPKNVLVDAMGKTVNGSANPLAAVRKREGNGRKSSWAIGREIVAKEGVRGLWTGGALRAVWTMVGSGLYLGVYESGRIYLASRRGESVDVDDIV
ncbi:mitochondrial carrier protein [Patellaria atrata CBS 101060]|uniref:Mitochondrial carrier protein n=1 Tax=Patellaria atrata CBS 101060 TaxID=1346257 RepID=A0A9P4SG62_9PEZI|nr:mitochondrial carrier protein [Patellaria atrata CBS 101060]